LNLDGKDIEIKVRIKEEYEGRNRFVKIIDVCTYTVPARDTSLLSIKRENDLRDNYELFREIQRDALKNNKLTKRQIIDDEDDEEEEEKGVLDKLGDRINELITPDVADTFMNMLFEKLFGSGGDTTTQPTPKQVSQNNYSRVNKIFKD